MQTWITELRQLGPQNLVLAIAGNKSDLKEQRQVSQLYICTPRLFVSAKREEISYFDLPPPSFAVGTSDEKLRGETGDEADVYA